MPSDTSFSRTFSTAPHFLVAVTLNSDQWYSSPSKKIINLAPYSCAYSPRHLAPAHSSPCSPQLQQLRISLPISCHALSQAAPRLCAAASCCLQCFPHSPPGKLLLTLQDSAHVSPPPRSAVLLPQGGMACLPPPLPSQHSCRFTSFESLLTRFPTCHQNTWSSCHRVSGIIISVYLGWHKEILPLSVVVE